MTAEDFMNTFSKIGASVWTRKHELVMFHASYKTIPIEEALSIGSGEYGNAFYCAKIPYLCLNHRRRDYINVYAFDIIKVLESECYYEYGNVIRNGRSIFVNASGRKRWTMDHGGQYVCYDMNYIREHSRTIGTYSYAAYIYDKTCPIPFIVNNPLWIMNPELFGHLGLLEDCPYILNGDF